MSDLTVELTGQELANYLKERFPPQELETTINKLIQNIETRSNMRHIKPIQGESPLSKHVRCWINNQVEGPDYDVQGVLKDLMYGGCQSGIVGHLIYYTDTTKFYSATGAIFPRYCMKPVLMPWSCSGISGTNLIRLLWTPKTKTF